jgi:uncharacterized protein YdaU (DUF1376 family)
MTKAYMPFYVGDFLKKTMHLSGVERGCYISLICHCWEHGSIPTDPGKLARICGVRSNLWWQYAPTVLAFFEPDNSVNPPTMTHRRVSTELHRYQEKAKHFKEGAEKRSESLAKDFANQNQNQNQEEKKKENLPPEAAGHAPPSEDGSKQVTPPPGFAEFWLAYPKKVSKPAAMRAWRQAIKRAPSETIMDALRVQKQTWKDPQYIKHPSTWLNNDCWSDQVEEKPKWHVLI